MIPENAPQAGRMANSDTVMLGVVKRFEEILAAWQTAVNEKHYVTEKYTHPADQVHGSFGSKYARLDIGGSGAFMVDIMSGLIYGIKGYGVVDKKKVSGNLYDAEFNGAILVRDRFRRGRFTNNADGGIPVLPRHGNSERRSS